MLTVAEMEEGGVNDEQKVLTHFMDGPYGHQYHGRNFTYCTRSRANPSPPADSQHSRALTNL